jgi:hypothetical protein
MDYMDKVFEEDSKPPEPTSIWEVAFECNVSVEGDMLDDNLDVTAYADGMGGDPRRR